MNRSGHDEHAQQFLCVWQNLMGEKMLTANEREEEMGGGRISQGRVIKMCLLNY